MTTTPHLETIEIESKPSPTASVIWMHGLGADAYDFYRVPPLLGLPEELRVRYIFPNAPRIPVTINKGIVMRAWYDVGGFDGRGQDEARIRESSEWITELVTREIDRGVEACRIVLAGFSQGGAMALFCGLRYPRTLAGIMCLSGYLPLQETLAEEASTVSSRPSIFQAHGTEDPVVPYELGRLSHDFLIRAGYQVGWYEYPMAHQVCDEELKDIGSWLTDLFSGDHRSGSV